MDGGASRGAGGPGGVHHHVRMALVGDDHQQFVGNFLFHALLRLLLQQIVSGGSAADAGHRHRHQDAPARHIQPQRLFRPPHQLGGVGRHAEQNRLLRGLQAQAVQNFGRGRAAAQGRQHQGDALFLIPGREFPAAAAVRNGDHENSSAHGSFSPLR